MCELYLLAEKFDADDAERIGYVTRTVDDGDLMKVVREVADKVAASVPLTVRAIKANLNDSLEMSFSDLMNREAERHQRCGTTRDSREAARAFLEKRPPVFEGR